jgi:uncharacterized protein YdcH (DUF465 family)
MTSRSRTGAASSRWLVPALALVLSLVAGVGCSSKPKPTLTPEQQAQADVTEYEALIRKVVADSARADKLVILTNEFQTLVKQGVASARDYRAKVAALDANYEATRADYETLIGQQDTARETFLEKARVLREQSASLTTDAEWEQLKKSRLRVLDTDLEELNVRVPGTPVVLTSPPPYS